ncbi:GNAT family N-acetyltransferase [Sporolactobacillus sp. CPB3-1]|uniref:GNAT family N-acetyltransferase n=1 Tax=Sporolactobacillus mangiferae TaxID=2940498 RepID=A0ABT0MCS7_9BACL|nr:GNAT family N-acetyltransferase [Sporolactobacillus mangiferae]MCL1632679.1 GNAT family N-acetyltransferase [Sporolactobacillus mangiferae]
MSQILKPLCKKDFNLFYQLMEASFPEEEYRAYDEELHLLDKKAFSVLVRYDLSGRRIEGFIAEWRFRTCSFLEQLAVEPTLRGRGIGSEMLKSYLSQTDKPVLIEVERPSASELAARRIDFYQRLGFILCSFGYTQPDLRPSGSRVDLLLMHYPFALSEHDLLARKKEIFHTVYGTEI